MAKKKTSKELPEIENHLIFDFNTGEYSEIPVTCKKEKDFNFHKVWLESLLYDLDLIGGKKFSVAKYVLENLTKDGLFIGTHEQIMKATETSRPTVAETINTLVEAKLFQKIANGVYNVNPDKLYKGSHAGRMAAMRRWTDNEKHVELTPQQKLNNIEKVIERLNRQRIALEAELSNKVTPIKKKDNAGKNSEATA